MRRSAVSGRRSLSFTASTVDVLRRRWRGVAAFAAVVAGLVVVAPATAGSIETQYVAQLRAASAQAVAAAAELGGLTSSIGIARMSTGG